MDFVSECNKISELEFKSQEWIDAYTALVKQIYNMEKLYVVISPKSIDYDYETGLPYVTKLRVNDEEHVMCLLFSDRIHADLWNSKHSNGRNFIGEIPKSMFNDFFAKCTLFKIDMCTINEGKDGLMFGNADMITINNIPTKVQVNVPKELRGKEKLTLKELNVEFNQIPISGTLSSNEAIEKLQLLEHVDIKVGALTQNDSFVVNNKVHLFLGGNAVSKWMASHTAVAGEYVLKEATVGELAMLAIKSEGSKGLVVDGLAPFSLFVDQNELAKVKSPLISHTVFSKFGKGEIDAKELKDNLMDVEFYLCKDDSERCGYDAMIRENIEGSFKAIQLYMSPESADKFNMAEHEVVSAKLSDVLEVGAGYGLIFEPYSHSWVEVMPE